MRAKLERVRYLRLLRSVCLVQRAGRAYLLRKQECVVKMQRVVRAWLARRRVVRLHSSATKIQVTYLTL